MKEHYLEPWSTKLYWMLALLTAPIKKILILNKKLLGGLLNLIVLLLLGLLTFVIWLILILKEFVALLVNSFSNLVMWISREKD